MEGRSLGGKTDIMENHIGMNHGLSAGDGWIAYENVRMWKRGVKIRPCVSLVIFLSVSVFHSISLCVFLSLFNLSQRTLWQ